MHNFTQSSTQQMGNNWQEERIELVWPSALLTSQLECTCLERRLGHLEAKSSRRNRLGVRQENREGKAGKIQLPCPPPGDLPNSGIEPISYDSCIDTWVLYH